MFDVRSPNFGNVVRLQNFLATLPSVPKKAPELFCPVSALPFWAARFYYVRCLIRKATAVRSRGTPFPDWIGLPIPKNENTRTCARECVIDIINSSSSMYVFIRIRYVEFFFPSVLRQYFSGSEGQTARRDNLNDRIWREIFLYIFSF